MYRVFVDHDAHDAVKILPRLTNLLPVFHSNNAENVRNIVKDFKVGAGNPPVDLNIISDYLSSKQVMELTRAVVSEKGLNLDGAGWLRSDSFLENKSLQRGVVVNLLVHMADVFDVDSTCEDVMKQFAKHSGRSPF